MNQAIFLCDRNELCGWDHAHIRLTPTQQSLNRYKCSSFTINYRLNMQLKLIIYQCLLQIGFGIKSFKGITIHLFTVELKLLRPCAFAAYIAASALRISSSMLIASSG